MNHMGRLRAYSIDIDRVISLRIVILSLAIFMLNNLLGIAILASYIVVNKSEDKGEYIMLFCLLSVFLGMINAGKMLESDLGGYYKLFIDCGKIPFLDYLSMKVKEPVFWIFTYITYYLTAGNFSIYVIICTFFIYFLIYYSLYKFYLFINKPELILYSVFCFTFFSPFFGISAHLIRQVLAASMLIYYMVNHIFYDRNRYGILLLAVFIHSSAWFFVPLIFMKIFKKRITVKYLLIAMPVTILLAKFYIVIFRFLTKLTSGIPAISYVFSRLTREITEKNEGQGLLPFLLLILLLLIAIYVLYFKKDVDRKIIHFFNIFLVLGLFVLLTKEQNLLSLRFYFYSYSFIAFILFYPVTFKNRLYHFLWFSIIGALAIKFVLFIEKGAWDYDSVRNILFYNAVDFFKII